MPLREWNLHFFWGFLPSSPVIQVNLKLKVEVFSYRIFTPAEPTAIRVALRDCARRCRNGISLREELRCTRGRRAGAPGREGSGGGGTVPGVGSGGGDIGEEELEEAAATHHAKRSEE